MRDLPEILFSPALRLKMGELEGVSQLAPEVADHVLPRFVVPPVADRDKMQMSLFEAGHAIPDVGGVLAKYWVRRRAFLDMTHLLRETGPEHAAVWLPKIFSRARSLQVHAIPYARLDDLQGAAISAFRASISDSDTLKLAIGVASGELVDAELHDKLSQVLGALDLTMADCSVIADFSDSEFSNPDVAAQIISGALETFQDMGPWRHIIFQGTHYPESNPAKVGETVIWPRNEWKAWRTAVIADHNTAQHFIYGDYAADCAKMKFGGGGVAAIRHYRYATENDWLIVRGKKGEDREVMRDVCQRIISSGLFAGPEFSTADAYIASNAATSAQTGSSTTWRQVNTTHHITRVVFDVAKVIGFKIVIRKARRQMSQLTLLIE